jgi:protein O-mannosyl-transferase
MALAAVAALAFAPVVGNGFVRWDDDRNFLENPAFSGLSLENVRWAWTTGLLGVYQPLAWMLMEAEFDAWGLNPRFYHVASLVGHAAIAVVLWVLTLALLERAGRGAAGPSATGFARRESAAAIAVALYAVHPLRAEVVSWASCQPYFPSVLLALLATLAYLGACDAERPEGRLGRLVGAWALYAMGLLTKIVPVMLPAILLVLDVYPLRRLGPGRWTGRGAWRVYGEKLPFLAVALPLMVVALRVRGADDYRTMHYDPAVRLARAFVTPGFYLIKTAFPLDLVAFYPPPADRLGYLEGMSAAAIATTLGVTVAAIAACRRLPGLAAAWACYLLALAPNLGLVRTGRSFLADRYSYFPSMAGAVVLGYALARLASRPRAWVLARAVAAVLVVGLSALSWRQCLCWRSSEAIWTRAFEYAPDDPNINMALGVAKNQEGKAAEAKGHFLRALEADGRNTLALVNLGGIELNEGDLAAAEATWGRALEIDPNEAEAMSGLALVRAKQGRFREAERFNRRALEVRPGYIQARNNLAAVLGYQGKFEEARAELARVVRDTPGDAVARYNLGQMLAILGRHTEALSQYAEAIRLDPGVASRYAGMGKSLLALKRDAEAARAFSAALGIDPNDPEARSGLDEIQSRRGRRDGRLP